MKRFNFLFLLSKHYRNYTFVAATQLQPDGTAFSPATFHFNYLCFEFTATAAAVLEYINTLGLAALEQPDQADFAYEEMCKLLRREAALPYQNPSVDFFHFPVSALIPVTFLEDIEGMAANHREQTLLLQPDDAIPATALSWEVGPFESCRDLEAETNGLYLEMLASTQEMENYEADMQHLLRLCEGKAPIKEILKFV